MRILVTGGAGYIGSHTVLQLLEAGHDVTVVDNLCNSSQESLRRVEALTGRQVAFHRVDLLDRAGLDRAFAGGCDAVIHFAGLKAVGESVSEPLRYWQTNVGGTFNLVQAMQAAGCRRLVFSSSATVYGVPERIPLTEDCRVQAVNPYGRTKLAIEEILRDLCAADGAWTCVLLRYFNPVGAHPSGRIGEDPAGLPNNLMPFVSQVAVGRLKELNVYGNDYPTRDGTGVRDYIHVVDLAAGHLAALDRIAALPGCTAINLGTGRGVSVLEMVKAFEQASGRKVPYRIVARRAGDVAECWADPSLAAGLLGWSAKLGLEAMCVDTWRWQSANPQGFGATGR